MNPADLKRLVGCGLNISVYPHTKRTKARLICNQTAHFVFLLDLDSRRITLWQLGKQCEFPERGEESLEFRLRDFLPPPPS